MLAARAANLVGPWQPGRRRREGAVPELPEVERARAELARRIVGREIEAVGDHDSFVCRPFAPGPLAAALTGERVTGVRRVGKQLMVDTTGPVLGLHLGM